MKRSFRVVIVLVFALLAGSIPTESSACYRCAYSPNNWGFCRSGFDRGHGGCSGYVADGFSGRTDCIATQEWMCFNGGTIYTGGCIACQEGPLGMAENNPCSWTDTDARQLV